MARTPKRNRAAKNIDANSTKARRFLTFFSLIRFYVGDVRKVTRPSEKRS